MNTTETTSSGDIPESEPSEPPQPGSDQALQVCDRTRQLAPHEIQAIREALHQLIEASGHRCIRYTIEIVDDARMSLLHERWKGDASTTDVLTFSMAPEGALVDGDVAICLDEAQRCAAELGHDRVRELVLYALHGFLHLTGHDDHEEDAYHRMHAEEDRLLDSIGFGAVFGRESVRSSGAEKNEETE